MRVLRVFNGPDGRSRFEEIEVPFVEDGPRGKKTSLIPATGILFRETGPSYALDFHPAPRRQYVLNLTGSVEIEVESGERRILAPGEVMLVDDLKGRGHRSRAAGDAIRKSVFVTLD